MKKYMVVTEIDGKNGAAFFDTKDQAWQYKMDAECGMGGEAEVYIRRPGNKHECAAYEFLFS